MHLESLESPQEAKVALGCASRNSFASYVLSKLASRVHTQAKYEPIVKFCKEIYLDSKPRQLSYPGRIGICSVFLLGEENRRIRIKMLGVRTRTNNKLKPPMAPDWNRTRATLVGGERAHQCAISVPQILDVSY